jgi:hypothetical protein
LSEKVNIEKIKFELERALAIRDLALDIKKRRIKYMLERAEKTRKNYHYSNEG